MSKWYRLAVLLVPLFTLTATALHSSDEAHAKTWRIDAVARPENKVEGFAGLHNEGRRILAVYDEASAIPDLIWETTEGALTDANTAVAERRCRAAKQGAIVLQLVT